MRAQDPWSRRWPAPAKLNLGLRILGRRPDGYHALQTVFQFTDWSDGIWLRPRRDGEIRRASGPAGVPADQDIAVRAALRLRDAAGVRAGAELAVRKRIPVGGGLGGGSSNAATVLIALNRLWGLHWPRPRLAELALGLGADVPVFVRGHAAFAEGIGETLTPVYPPERWYLVLDPGAAVSTAAVFAHAGLTRHSPAQTISAFLEAPARNDCAATVCELYPAVGEALAWLGRHGPAQLSGTGGCVYLPLETRAAARALYALVPDRWRARVVRGVNVHPLAEE